MPEIDRSALRKASPYSAVLTREQFLFYEMRTTAKLLSEGLDEKETVKRIIEENLFQYPTEKSVSQMARVCVSRLKGLKDDALIKAVAEETSETAKQICLYSMMKKYRLVWDFMITVIGEKYRLQDYAFGRIELNTFFLRLQEQDDWVATWSDKTVSKLKQILIKTLTENEYLDSIKSERLNPVLLCPILEEAIRRNGDTAALPAFNYFS